MLCLTAHDSDLLLLLRRLTKPSDCGEQRSARYVFGTQRHASHILQLHDVEQSALVIVKAVFYHCNIISCTLPKPAASSCLKIRKVQCYIGNGRRRSRMCFKLKPPTCMLNLLLQEIAAETLQQLDKASLHISPSRITRMDARYLRRAEFVNCL